jgi:DNA repair exonuclease SbcCD ATPase subunit
LIIFETIKIQNFGSVGNAPIEISYNKAKSTLVTAVNGSGKSMLLTDALSFVLYGRPYRNINKPQLINTINQKGCLVTLNFKINKASYKIVRGLKPNIFELYKNDELINQDAASRDYQKYLESNILKMNYRTFTQVVIMGSGNYIPFMKLSPAQRREFIEDILDIKIFSTMNMLLKQKIKDTDESEFSVNNSLKTMKEKVALQEEFIDVLRKQKENHVQDIQAKIEKLTDENKNAFELMTSLQNTFDMLKTEYQGYSDIQEKISELKHLYSSISKAVKKHTESKNFYKNMDTCPTCNQTVSDSQKNEIIKVVEVKINDSKNAVEQLKTKIESMNAILDELDKKYHLINETQAKISSLQSSINASNQLINQYQKDMSKTLSDSTSVDNEKSKIKELSKSILALDKQRKELNETKHINDVAYSLLKDTGIKSKIIKQYIPIFNKLINMYLQKLEMFVSFNLDENFNETVKSRYRDNFTYDSFSAGEKQRIDLSLMFVFREIARLKNAVSVNVLIMDEILDASLDTVGVDNFFSIVDNLDKTNLFVISHRENMADRFSTTLKLIKQNNYTIVDSSTYK